MNHVLRIAILNANLTQRDFAKGAKVSPEIVNMIINGRGEYNTSPRIKIRIITALRAHGWQGRDSEIFP